MKYQTTKPIRSLSGKGVSLRAGQPCTPQAFTPELWQALLNEGAIVEIETAVPEPVKPKPRTRRKPRKKTNA